MMLLTLITFLFLCVFGTYATDNCTMVDWKEHSSDITNMGAFLTKVASDPVVKNFLKKEDPHNLPGDLLRRMAFQITKKVIYDYRMAIEMVRLKVEHFSTVKFEPVTVLNNGDLKLGLSFDKLDITGLAEVDIHQDTQSGCDDTTEEAFASLCYRKCRLLQPSHPKRTAGNTCAKDGCDPDRIMHQGLCYKPCGEKYHGVGPVCWGRCDKFFGKDYRDTGATCHRLHPAHAVLKPTWNRGIGKLPHEPWTKGFGCNGFGISTGGGCPYPYWRICMLDNMKILGPGKCLPKKAYGDVDYKLLRPKVEVVLGIDAPECTEPAQPGEEVSPKIACIVRSLIYVALGALDPAQAQQSLTHLNTLKSKMSRVTIKSFKLHWADGSRTDFDFSHNIPGLVGWIVDLLKGRIISGLSEPNSMKQLINDKLLNEFVKKAGNEAIDKELKNNRCRSF